MDRPVPPVIGKLGDIEKEIMRMKLVRSRWLGSLVGLGLVCAVALGASRGFAQDATPVAELPDGLGSSHPAHIHVGTCETLDPNPLVPLANVTFGAVAAEASASPEATGATPAAGATMAIEGGTSITVVDLPLAGILAAEHAINVHLSDEQPEVYVACGAIGGTPDENGDLFIGLKEQNGSNVSGIAWLHDNGDGATTTVTLVLSFGLSEDAADAADPGATPAASPAA